MDAFLAGFKDFSNDNASKVFNVVLGNESGDLDSVVCSASLAFHLTANTGVRHVPLMAFDRKDLDLRTEVLYCFRRLNLDPAYLVFADDLDLKKTNVDSVVLVDHNRVNNPSLAALDAKVTTVIDHHVLERSAAASEGVDMTVKTVGSCSMLVAEKIFTDDPGFKDEDVLNLIRWTILTDTSNLSPVTKKATDEDVRVLEDLERRLGISADSRTCDFNLISMAKADTSHFDCTMLIRKDMKVIRLKSDEGVAVSATMSSISGHACSDVVRRQDFANHVAEHATAGGHALVMMTGGGGILLYPSKGNLLCEAVKSKLVAADPEAGISVVADEIAETRDAVYLTKSNAAYTRKKLLPIVRDAVAEALKVRPVK